MSPLTASIAYVRDTGERPRYYANAHEKDTIVLDIPAETGVFDTVLLTRATRKIKDSTTAWAEYAATHADGDSVDDHVRRHRCVG